MDALNALKRKTGLIIRRLRLAYPDARIGLRFAAPFELMVAVILSAQCTDKRVNIVTEGLFKKYRDIADYAAADVRTFEQDIRSTGFFRNKSRNIIAAARMLLSEYGGRIPDTMAELIRLPGVARKTGNIILHTLFGKPEGIAVDTHVRRISRRLGLSGNDNPASIERDLMRIVPKRYWGTIGHLLIEHGRAVCAARKPRCNECVVSARCDYYAASQRR
ncbi:MAG: endonuclease III [Candidatus Omnitrophica bacterium]|nr:endonuclease III [Candidatus Omnitrophota bacterium]